ncbi:MAG: osmoprotectant transport system permease protein [Chlamydiales bacterium]|jgi:osmoprotectant transport system permease protein
MRSPGALLLLVLCAGLSSAAPQTEQTFVIGSKNFTESRLLGELIVLMLEEHTDLNVEHRAGLGGTLVCHEALLTGELDLYPDYTGTGWAVVLKEPERVTDPLRTFLHVQAEYRERFDVEWLQPFGFDNTYAIAVDRDFAARLGLERISDLVEVEEPIRAGLGIEFVNREDGYPGLSSYYGLELSDVRVIEHGLAYDAIASGAVDLIDAYSTDGKLLSHDLKVLEDDRAFFPPYHAAALIRGESLRAHPEVAEVLARLAFRIPDDEMIALNHAVDVERRGFREVAREFLVGHGLLAETDEARVASDVTRLSPSELGQLIVEHLRLTFLAVLLAAALAIPLGIHVSRRAHLRRLTLACASVMQTVPSLALLALLIAVPGLGLTERSAILALFLYALLPILRNTVTGLAEVDPSLIDAARGMGLTPAQILLRIQLPLATRTIMAGVRTATVISIGVATLAAFIGAGGLGEPILTGLYLNDTRLILFGAIPAALLALLVDAALAQVESRLVPRGLRSTRLDG